MRLPIVGTSPDEFGLNPNSILQKLHSPLDSLRLQPNPKIRDVGPNGEKFLEFDAFDDFDQVDDQGLLPS